MEGIQSNGPMGYSNPPKRSRRGSVSPFCRVTGKSISMEDHHYIPSWEDFQQHGSPYRCRITEKNKYFKDYKYVYPIIDVDGTTRMITEHDFHCRITSKYRAMAGYKYLYPVLGASTDKTKEQMSSVMEDPLLKDVLVPKEVEQIVRGGIGDVLRLNESEYLFIVSKEGSVFPAAVKEIAPWKKKKVDNKFARRHTLPVSLDSGIIVNSEGGFDPAPQVKKICDIKTPVVPEMEVDSLKKTGSDEKISNTKGKDATRKRVAPSKGKNQNRKKSNSGIINGTATSESTENVRNVTKKSSTDTKAVEMKDQASTNYNAQSVNGDVISNGICDKENENGYTSNKTECRTEIKETTRLSRLEKYKMQFQSFEKPKDDNTSGSRLVMVGAYNEDEAVELDFGDTVVERDNATDNSEYVASNSESNCDLIARHPNADFIKRGSLVISDNCDQNSVGLRNVPNETKESVSENVSENSGYISMDGSNGSLALRESDGKSPEVNQLKEIKNINSPLSIDFITLSSSPNHDTIDDSTITGYSSINGSVSPPSSSTDTDAAKTERWNTSWSSEKENESRKLTDLNVNGHGITEDSLGFDKNLIGDIPNFYKGDVETNVRDQKEPISFQTVGNGIHESKGKSTESCYNSEQKAAICNTEDFYPLSSSRNDMENQNMEKLNSSYSNHIGKSTVDHKNLVESDLGGKSLQVLMNGNVDDGNSPSTDEQNERCKHTFMNGDNVNSKTANMTNKFPIENKDSLSNYYPKRDENDILVANKVTVNNSNDPKSPEKQLELKAHREEIINKDVSTAEEFRFLSSTSTDIESQNIQKLNSLCPADVEKRTLDNRDLVQSIKADKYGQIVTSGLESGPSEVTVNGCFDNADAIFIKGQEKNGKESCRHTSGNGDAVCNEMEKMTKSEELSIEGNKGIYVGEDKRYTPLVNGVKHDDTVSKYSEKRNKFDEKILSTENLSKALPVRDLFSNNDSTENNNFVPKGNERAVKNESVSVLENFPAKQNLRVCKDEDAEHARAIVANHGLQETLSHGDKWGKVVDRDSDFTQDEKSSEFYSSVKYPNQSKLFVYDVEKSLITSGKATVESILEGEFENEVTECQKLRLPTTTSLLCRERIFPGAIAKSLLLREVGSGLDVTTILKDHDDSTGNVAKSNTNSQQVPDVYVAIMDFKPMESDDEAVPMKEGQQVEIVDATKPRRWLVRTRPLTLDEEVREGWVPACYLEKSTAEKTLSYVVTEPSMDPKEMEALENREAVVKELVETEEDFAKDLQFVVENYYKHLDSANSPKEMRDRKGSIFGNFKDICDFHNNVLIKGVQFHAKEPTRLGKTFLRLERDFDMHAGYCWNEARAQRLLQEGPLRDYFDEHSREIDDDKTLSDHLKLPIQRLNDYQLLLKEIIKYSSRLNEDTSDLQKALDFIHSINKRTKDLQYIQALKGCTGDILKLGRIIKHDLFDVTEGSQASSSERVVFLFKGRIFLTEKRMEEGKESYHVTNLFKLQEVEMIENVPEDPLQILFRHTKKGRQGFPCTIRAKTQEQKDIWIKEITAGSQAEDLGDQEPALLVTGEPQDKVEKVPSKPSELKHKADEVAVHPEEPESKKSKVVRQKSKEEAPKVVKKKEKPEESSKPESAPHTPTETAEDKKPDLKKQRSVEEKRTKRQSSKEGAAKELSKDDSESNIPKESEAKTPEKKEQSQPDTTETVTPKAAEAKPPIPKDQDKGKKQKPGKPGQEGTDMATKPGFSKTLRGVTCSLGEAAALECETEGTPAPSVTWLKDNRKITKSKRIETTSKGQKHSLKIKDTTADDAGLYTVVASNASGSASCSAPLNLKMALLGLPKEDSRPTTPGGTLLPHTPVFKVKLNKETQLLEGTCVRFELVVRGHPEPTVKFFKDNKELKQDERVRVVYESKEVFELILDHVVASDAGNYSCVATNSEGSDTTVGNLTVTKTKDVFKGLEEELEEEREPSPRPRTPKFKWFKNGQDFEASERFQVMFNEEDDSLALLFQHVTPDDAGLYTCVASTSSGSKIACSAELTVQGVVRQVEAPAIKAELSDVEASEGGSAMLELKITGYPKPKVTWFHKKKEVQSGGRFRFLFADEESFTLVIKSVKKDDGGQYTVKAANELGEVESSCKLTVKSAPSFVKGLKDMSVMADEVIKFEVEIDGNPAPEIKWYKDGQQLAPSDRVKISSADKKCALQVSKAKPGDSGSYSCVLTNSLGSQAEFGNVVVKASPTFIKEMENIEGVESDTLQFNVEVAGNPKPTLKWSKDGKELKVDGKHIKVTEEGTNAYSLVIGKATLADTGVYTCELRNDHGMKASSGNLNLKTKPEFIKKLSDLEANEGDANLELSVSLKGYPSPSTKWLLDGKDLADNKSYVISHDTQTGVHTLRLKKVHRDLSGKYSCEASNSMGTAVTSGVLSVHVPSKKPEFDQSLKPVQLVEGKPGKLEAKVSGEPKPKIKWLKDGKEITPNGHYTFKEEPDGTLSLLIDDVTAGDAGTYAIVAVSDLGEAKCEAPVTTIPAGKKPKFLKELEKANLMEGQPLKLGAKVEGNPTSIKWQKDGDDLSPSNRIAITEEADGTIALKIDEVNRNDAGKYTVIATNAEGKARSAALVEVKAVSKPEILSGLEPLTLTDGETGQLKAKVSGEPKPSVKWLKDGKELKPSNRIEAAEEPDGVMTLTIKNARPEDAGNYSVVVCNVKGEVKNSAPVTVNQAPTFHKPLKPVDVVEGYPAKLEAKIGGSPLPELKWMKDNKEVSPDGVHVKEIRSPDGAVALLIDDCKPEDAGKYSLCLKNPLGEQSSDGDLSVAGKGSSNEPELAPKFMGPIGDVAVKEGDPIRFETLVSGNPLPDITWTFNNEPLKPSDDTLITFDGKKAILEIKNSKPEHIGTYQCNLSNPLGKANSEGSASVQEKTAPRFTQRLTDFNGCMGKPMKMLCKVKGFPDPEIDWYHNGNRIDAGSKYTIGRTGDLCSLSVNDCKPEDSGIYECKACNPLGEDCTRAEASISDKVEKGESPMFLKKIGDNEVMEGMTARFTACITGIPTPEIKWTKDGQPLELTPRHKTELDSTGILRLVIKDVDPADYGEYNVVISNCHGSATSSARLLPDSLDPKYISPIGDQFIDFDKFKKSGAPVPLPDKPRIIRMYDNFLTLGWKPSVPNAPRIPVTYQIEMAKHPDGEWSPYKTGLQDTLCDVQGLTPGQDYRFRIRVENKYGVSEPSPYTTAHCSKIYEPRVPADFAPKDFEIEHPPLEKIAAAPRFLRKEEAMMYGIRGHPVTITFWVYGYPEPQVSWYKDDSKIEKGKYDFLQDRNGKVSVFIDSMSDSYVGTYLCHAVNDEGESKMKIKLLIAEAPVFIKRLDETTGMMRRCGRMQCKVTGVPYPKIKWHRDWHPLYESEKVKILWEEPDVCTLFISNLITRDAGLYSCSASNIAGSTSCSASLNVEDSEDVFDTKTYSRPITVKPRSKPFEDFYDLGDELGRGTQGITYHAVKRDTGNSYAAKMMHGKGKLKHFMKNEMDIMNQICHPKLVRLWDAFDTKDSMTLLADICGGGELLDNILRRGTLTEREVAYYIKQLLEGLDHMHGRFIGHLGLTVGDLLVSRVHSYDIKVGDFGLAARLIPGKDYFLEYGHPEFTAPEIANKLPATLLSDMWSVGVITYLLLSGISPFLGEHDRETLTRVQQGKINFSPDAFSGVTEDAKDFMSKLLVFDPSGRMNVKTALQHRWIKDYADIPSDTDKPLNNIDRLKDYYKRWKDWYANASCRTYYRRRTLESCFHHPSRMIYPPGEEYTPASSPEPDLDRTHVKPSHFDDTFRQKINREEIDFRSESNYQNGPDTYLLQLRDTDFPLRLRQYLRVGASTSPSLALSLRERHWGDSTLVIRERRKFVDVMDEEIDDERKGLTTRTVPMRLYHEVGTMGYAHEQMESLKKEVWKDKGSRELEIGSQPFFRETLQDLVMREDEKVVFTCYAVGTPKPSYAWFRNDGFLLESSRVVVKELENGKCELRINPSRAYDAGVYKCVARNMHGVTVCRARLKIGDKPGRPEPPCIKSMSDTEAYLTWTAPRDEGHSPTLCYALEYKKSDVQEWTTVRENISHEFFVIRNLIPSTFYQFRVKAMNKFGWGEPGFSTEPISTKEQGADPVKTSIQRKFQQELTESSSEFLPDEIEITDLDYSRENNPVPLVEGDTLELYRIVSEVARGRFSVVLNVWVKQSNTTCIAKVIKSTPSADPNVRQECDIIRSLCHERIVTLLSASFNGQKTVLVMEKLSGIDVLTFLSRRQDYNEELVIKIIKQVFEAIHYLHFRGICYIELQPDNVVMVDSRHPDIKLVDFGSARAVPKSGGKVEVKGTVEYLAPEVLKNEDVSTLTDVWAVGVLTYILLSGVSPFRGKTDEETADNVAFVRYQFDNMFKDITAEATRFILNVFKACPIKRPTVAECLENKWLLPSEYMIMKRESARFLPDKLFSFAKEFHSAKADAMDPEMLTSLGMSSSRKEIQEVEY